MSTIIDDLATVPGVQAYLLNHPEFAAHTVEQLGVSGNFAYRIYLLRAFAGHRTLVLKYAPPYIASSGGTFPFDQKRQVMEVQALRLAAKLSSSSVPAFITVPTIHHFDEEKHVIIMDDAGKGSRTLKELLIAEDLPRSISEQIGAALGKFIYNVHTWNQNPDVDLALFASHQDGKYISVFATYGRLESTLSGKDKFSELSDPSLEIPEVTMKTISRVAEKRKQAIYAASESDPMTHGDFWPGNLVVSLKRGIDGSSIEGVEKLYVLDWELSKTGLPGLDLGQLCAELYVLSEFYPARVESTRAMIESFLDAYRQQKGRDVELTKTVVSHIGAHAVVWTPRVSSWTGREKTREVVEKGAAMLVLGEEGSESSLQASIAGRLLEELQ